MRHLLLALLRVRQLLQQEKMHPCCCACLLPCASLVRVWSG